MPSTFEGCCASPCAEVASALEQDCDTAIATEQATTERDATLISSRILIKGRSSRFRIIAAASIVDINRELCPKLGLSFRRFSPSPRDFLTLFFLFFLLPSRVTIDIYFNNRDINVLDATTKQFREKLPRQVITRFLQK